MTFLSYCESRWQSCKSNSQLFTPWAVRLEIGRSLKTHPSSCWKRNMAKDLLPIAASFGNASHRAAGSQHNTEAIPTGSCLWASYLNISRIKPKLLEKFVYDSTRWRLIFCCGPGRVHNPVSGNLWYNWRMTRRKRIWSFVCTPKQHLREDFQLMNRLCIRRIWFMCFSSPHYLGQLYTLKGNK